MGSQSLLILSVSISGCQLRRGAAIIRVAMHLSLEGGRRADSNRLIRSDKGRNTLERVWFF